MKDAIVFIGVWAIVVGMLLLNGVIISDMWTWFIVPIFDVQKITTAQSIGLGIIVGYMAKYHKAVETDEEKEKKFEVLFITIFYALFTWLVAYIVSLFL